MSHPPNIVRKLKSSLYGLKQASRQWFAKLIHELLNQGFAQSKNDYSLFVKKTPTSITIAAIDVNEIVLASDDPSRIQQLKQHLHQVFSIKEHSILSFFLGIEVSYVPQGIILSQKKFTTKLIQDSEVTLLKRVVAPLLVTLNFINQTLLYFLIQPYIEA